MHDDSSLLPEIETSCLRKWSHCLSLLPASARSVSALEPTLEDAMSDKVAEALVPYKPLADTPKSLKDLV